MAFKYLIIITIIAELIIAIIIITIVVISMTITHDFHFFLLIF